MKKFKIVLFIALSTFASLGFVIITNDRSEAIELEQVAPAVQSDNLETISESNEDIW